MMDMYILEIMRITLHPDILPKATISRYQKALCQLGTHGQQTHEFYSLTILS